ncbi:MAG: PfkB family carbohydrate kinase [Cyanobacteriota bacterium]
MNKITKQDLFPVFEKLAQGRVMVIGDLAIDEMVYGEAARISREAPVLILKHSNTKIILGAASNAANNIAALGAKKVSVLGVCGNDYHAPQLIEAFEKSGINTSGIVKDPNRPTSTKTRISAASPQSVTQQIVRIDREDNTAISDDVESHLIENMHLMAEEHDAILLSCYGIGVVTPEVIKHAKLLAKQKKLILAVDAQLDLQRFRNSTVITPNQPEAEASLGYKMTDFNSVKKGGWNLLNQVKLDMLLMTRGGEGMILFQTDGTLTKIPAFNKTDVFDVTGAGDTVVGSLVLALAAGIDPKLAAVLGNLAASIVIREFGAAVTNIETLQYTLEKLKIDYVAEYTLNKEDVNV